MSNFIDYLYFNFLHEPFTYLIGVFVNERYGVFVLIGVIIIVSIIQGNIGKLNISGKIKYLPKFLNLLAILVFILLLAVSYIKYQPTVAAFLKSSSSPKAQTTSPPKDGSGIQKTPTQQKTPSYQAPKQLYYAVSCSSCWNETCPRNGYSYGGYNESLYYYYRTLCQNCRCNSYKAQSLWR